MEHYTVIGFFSSTGQKYVNWMYAESPEDAVAKTARLVSGEIEIVAVFEGLHSDVLCGEYVTCPEDMPEEDDET